MGRLRGPRISTLSGVGIYKFRFFAQTVAWKEYGKAVSQKHMSQNNPSDESPGLGHFLKYRHWRDALCLLRYQLKRKEKNRHFRTLEMSYYEKLKESFKALEDEEYFKARVANNLFYGLTNEFAVIPYTIPKPNLGLRRYKFMTCPMRVLYYAIGFTF